MSLAALAAFAVANNNSSAEGRTPVYKLTIEEARNRIKIGDGNKKPKEDGSQALTLSLGKIKVGLDIIAPKATRVNAPADQVEAFTASLQEAVDNGSFDEAIKAAQFKADPANKQRIEAPTTEGSEEAPVAETEAPAQVDLDSLED